VVLTALRGGLGFLTRIPAGQSGTAWEAFARRPAVFPIVGYVLGALVAIPVLLAGTRVPVVVVASLTLACLYLVSGITHVDGLADLGDAVVVHGDPETRVEVLTDSMIGVGGTVAVVVALVGTGLGFVAIAALPVRQAVAIVVAAEVGAKLTMAALACLGTAAFDGLGSAFTEPAGLGHLPLAVVLAVPAAALSWPTTAAAGALLGALVGGGLVATYAARLLGGVNGDVFGATNEIARLLGLHLGVIAWTLS
jgi:adenosylcobinamide-GDP ribazoletransferase